jgi:hypothetical protein
MFILRIPLCLHGKADESFFRASSSAQSSGVDVLLEFAAAMVLAVLWSWSQSRKLLHHLIEAGAGGRAITRCGSGSDNDFKHG